MKINEKIKKSRIDSGMTQKQVAESVGVDKNTISRFENGRNGIGYFVLEKIVDLLGLELTKKINK